MILVGILAGASLIVGCGAGYLWYKRTNSLSPHLPEAGGVAPFETLPSGQMLYSFNYENRHPRDYELAYSTRKSCYTYHDEPLDYVGEAVEQCFKPFDEPYYSKKKAQENSLSDVEIRERWHAENDEAQRVGLFMHRQMNNRLLDKPFQVSMAYSYVTEHTKISKLISIAPEMNQFQQFLSENELHPYRSMWTVFDEESRLAGTVDLLAVNGEGKYVVYNWTRSHTLGEETIEGYLVNNANYGTYGEGPFRHIPDSPFHREALQMSLLCDILRRKYGIDVVSAHTAVFYSENMRYHIVDLPMMADAVALILRHRQTAPSEAD